MRGLYAIVDVDAVARRGLAPMPFAEAVLEARPAALQLRAKRCGGAATLAILRALAPLCHGARVPLFANDRPDLAALAGADGVHVGQDDVPPPVARAVGPALLVGISTHDAPQMDAVLAQPRGYVDYIAVGPVFPTSSKDDASQVLAIEGLDAIVARATKARPEIPTVAIGGIDVDRIALVAARVSAVAVIGALLPDAGEAAPYAGVRARALELVARCVDGAARRMAGSPDRAGQACC